MTMDKPFPNDQCPDQDKITRYIDGLCESEEQGSSMVDSEDVIDQVKSLIPSKDQTDILEVVLVLAKKGFQDINTTGDVIDELHWPFPNTLSHIGDDETSQVAISKTLSDIRLTIGFHRGHHESTYVIVKIDSLRDEVKVDDLRFILFQNKEEITSASPFQGIIEFHDIIFGAYMMDIINTHQCVGRISIQLIKNDEYV